MAQDQKTANAAQLRPGSPDYPPHPVTDPGHLHTHDSVVSGGANGMPLDGGTAPFPTMWGGTGAPANGLGAVGDIYVRADGVLGTSFIYRKTGASAWTASAA